MAFLKYWGTAMLSLLWSYKGMLTRFLCYHRSLFDKRGKRGVLFSTKFDVEKVYSMNCFVLHANDQTSRQLSIEYRSEIVSRAIMTSQRLLLLKITLNINTFPTISITSENGSGFDKKLLEIPLQTHIPSFDTNIQ